MKQYHFTQGSCSTPGSTTWRSRPFYCEKIRSNPCSPWYIWWLFNENHTFWGVFKVSFLPCFQNLLKISIFGSEFWFIAFILIIFFQIFGGSKHAILGKIAGRAHVRGGRDHFTARKFDQIPGRLDTFGDFLTKIIRFEVFSRLVFYLVFKICSRFQFLFQNFGSLLSF